jgi:hypothetical protein
MMSQEIEGNQGLIYQAPATRSYFSALSSSNMYEEKEDTLTTKRTSKREYQIDAMSSTLFFMGFCFPVFWLVCFIVNKSSISKVSRRIGYVSLILFIILSLGALICLLYWVFGHRNVLRFH